MKKFWRFFCRWWKSWRYRGFRIYACRNGWVVEANSDKATAFFSSKEQVRKVIDYAHYIGMPILNKKLKPFDGGEPYRLAYKNGRCHKIYWFEEKQK